MTLHKGLALWLLERGIVLQAVESLAQLAVYGCQFRIPTDQHRGGTARKLTADRLPIK
ncbi:hypothetical protein KBY93_13015 [Synechococcus sp. J7-Johnson]|uniref:hypothetical protein n=1 Tax=Synechococcus sp. J7-Johnson TaxID=2823737 RepID=UPI0020CE23EA|nr:hypothetical protein [Synechococcus sp. J7-Johnson]MCP9841548.1 hypothetical protein [Synechococcus sp. J7-Johnson]